MTTKESFSNRWGIVLASLGMAIGAGNLWRFPRLAGQYGGSFILLWIVFLFIWSIPLLLAEFSIGKKFRQGVIGSFGLFAGKKLVWMGFFITLCTLGIAFYYSVVTAWALRYLGITLSNLLYGVDVLSKSASDPAYLTSQWRQISSGSLLTVGLNILIISAAIGLLSKGIRNGLEKANRVLIPLLFLLMLFIVGVSLNLENGVKGLEYMFLVRWELFAEPNVWIEALSQSAWSTGAGWGLMMVLSTYSQKKEDVTLNTFIGAFGNNTASLIAGMAILPAVFALSSSEQDALSYLQSGNQALTFTIIPKLFVTVPGGNYLAVFFFLALFFAAFSSLLPMMELFISHVKQLVSHHRKSYMLVWLVFVFVSFPSAYSLDFFNNQDWVWGVGLVLSGLFLTISVLRYGATPFKEELIDADSDIKVSHNYFAVTLWLNAALALVLIYWWLSRGYSDFPWFNSNGNWNLFDVYSNASVVTQWVMLLIAGLLLNKVLYKYFVLNQKS